MSGVLDACTSYGTHVFWPFSDDRVAFNIISIIDPAFTLILLITLIASLKIKRQKIAQVGLLFAVGYMTLGFVQLQRAQNMADGLITSRGHHTNQHVVKPTLANLFLWRSVYVHKNRIYIDAIRVGLIAENKIYEGESIEKFLVKKYLPTIKPSSVLYNDIQRFKTFSNDYIAFDQSQKNVIGDLRYSMLPISAKPLWGIVINKNEPQQHADYRFFRDSSTSIRQQFINMLLGREQ